MSKNKEKTATRPKHKKLPRPANDRHQNDHTKVHRPTKSKRTQLHQTTIITIQTNDHRQLNHEERRRHRNLIAPNRAPERRPSGRLPRGPIVSETDDEDPDGLAAPPKVVLTVSVMKAAN